MITMDIIGTGTKEFNLNNFDREKQLAAAWKALHGDAKYSKKFKVTTTDGESFEVDIMQVRSCKFDNAVYYGQPEVKTK